MTDTPDDDRRNLLERLLGLFAKVRAGEGLVAVLMFVNVFLILNAYYILKTVREGLIIGEGGMFGISGAELKIYASAGMALLLLGVVPAYGALASKVDRLRLLTVSVAVVIGCVAGFIVLGSIGIPLALVFFLWLGIVSVFLVAQFWSYANDIYTEEQGKRLFAIIALGGSLGAIFGPKVAEYGKAHTLVLMAVAAAVLSICLLLYRVVNRMVQRRDATDTARAHVADQPLSNEGGFTLVFRQRYLLLIALMLLIANLVNTTGEFILTATVENYAAEVVPADSFPGIENETARQAQIEAARRAVGTGFFGSFFSLVNLVGFLIQAFLVSRIFKYLGVRVALFFLPVIALGSYGLIGLAGGLTLLRVGKTAENSTDYSLQNTVRQALFLPTSREVKYKAKTAIDTFFVRFGDAIAAAVVAFGTHGLALSPRAFAFGNVALSGLWIALVIAIARLHKQLSPDATATATEQ